MFTRIVMALAAVLIFGTATAAIARTKAKVYTAYASVAAPGAPAIFYSRNRVVGYDTSGAGIFGGQLTPTCLLSLKQQSRC
jgi:hypothetical protein